MGFAVRFLVEAGFLVLLAVAIGFADLRPVVIVSVMAAGWVLVTLIELLAWRIERGAPRIQPYVPQPTETEEELEPVGWPIEDILAPVPEDEPEHTRVLPSSDDERGFDQGEARVDQGEARAG